MKQNKFKRFIKKVFINKEQQQIKHNLKYAFYSFFEGIDDYGEMYADIDGGSIGYTMDKKMVDPIVDIPVHKFGITKVDFAFKSKEVILTITLNSPGIFIGKGGKNISLLMDHLNNNNFNKKVKLHVEEAKNPWSVAMH